MLLALALLACTSEPSIQWLVAASVAEAAEAVASEFTTAQHLQVQVSGASSSVLARQVVAGARAELFLSASSEWADAVGAHQRARSDLLGNSLVVLRHPDAPPWSPPAEPPGCVAVGDPEHVPVGRYAVQALGADWAAVAPEVVPTVDAPAAVRAVQTGACPYAIAYVTDAPDAGLVVQSSLPDVGIRYPLVRLDDGDHARALYDWVGGPEAAAIFVAHGLQRAP